MSHKKGTDRALLQSQLQGGQTGLGQGRGIWPWVDSGHAERRGKGTEWGNIRDRCAETGEGTTGL